MAEWLLERFPNEQEGALGSRLAHLVSRVSLAEIADRLDLPQSLTVAAHEARAGVQTAANVVADALEAVLGAVFLDGGLEPARQMVRDWWKSALDAQAHPPKDPKTALQEWVLGRGQSLPVYETIGQMAPLTHRCLWCALQRVACLVKAGPAANVLRKVPPPLIY